MSGSMTYRQYGADNGATYSIRCDESNASATASAVGGDLSAALLPVRIANQPAMPKGLRPRYVNTYNSVNPAQKRRFMYSLAAQTVVLQSGAVITAEGYPSGGIDSAGTIQTWIVTSATGEKSKLPPAFTSPDTGLTDGTVSQ